MPLLCCHTQARDNTQYTATICTNNHSLRCSDPLSSNPCRELYPYMPNAVVTEACHPFGGYGTERAARGNEQIGSRYDISYRELSFEQDSDKIALLAGIYIKYVYTGQVTHCECLFVRYRVFPHSVTVNPHTNTKRPILSTGLGVFLFGDI